MKMMIVIIKDNEADALTRALTSAEYRVTRIASTGGLLHSGVATLLMGVDDEKVDSAMALVRETVAASGRRPERTTGELGEKRATVFVVPVSRFEQV
jgi:uncharacterized protein YaaQ